MRRPLRPSLTCPGPSCDARIDEVRILDYGVSLDHYGAFAEAVCGLTSARPWPGLPSETPAP